jgi:hypothetical protein
MNNSQKTGIFERASLFETEAHALLEMHEDAHRSRVIKLGELVQRLTSLNLRQEGLFRQAIRCAENGIYLAAHVMTWAALMDLYEEKIASDGLVAVRREYQRWPTTSLEELRENVNEFQLIDAGRKIGLLSKGIHKSMQGHLHTRNQAAHPTGFDPGINETLGYIESLIKLASAIESRTL